MNELAQIAVQPCFYVLATLGVVSGLDYIISWGSKAYRAGKQRKLYKHGPGQFRRMD